MKNKKLDEVLEKLESREKMVKELNRVYNGLCLEIRKLETIGEIGLPTSSELLFMFRDKIEELLKLCSKDETEQ